jgi:hypothetical protein
MIKASVFQFHLRKSSLLISHSDRSMAKKEGNINLSFDELKSGKGGDGDRVRCCVYECEGKEMESEEGKFTALATFHLFARACSSIFHSR